MLIATAIPAVAFILFQATHGEVLQHWLAPVFPTLALVAVAAASTIPTTTALAAPPHPHRRRAVCADRGAGRLRLRDDAARPLFPRQGPDRTRCAAGRRTRPRSRRSARRPARRGSQPSATRSRPSCPTSSATRRSSCRSPSAPAMPSPRRPIPRCSTSPRCSSSRTPRLRPAAGCFATLTEVGAATRRGAGTVLDESRVYWPKAPRPTSSRAAATGPVAGEPVAHAVDTASEPPSGRRRDLVRVSIAVLALIAIRLVAAALDRPRRRRGLLLPVVAPPRLELLRPPADGRLVDRRRHVPLRRRRRSASASSSSCRRSRRRSPSTSPAARCSTAPRPNARRCGSTPRSSSASAAYRRRRTRPR